MFVTAISNFHPSLVFTGKAKGLPSNRGSTLFLQVRPCLIELSEGAEVSWRVCKIILKFWPQPTVPHLDMVDEIFPTDIPLARQHYAKRQSPEQHFAGFYSTEN